MLRGQASLQELVGRGLSFKRKPPAKTDKQKKKPKLSAPGLRTGSKEEKAADPKGSRHKQEAETSKGDQSGSSAPPGSVCCPVCGKNITNVGSNFDQHLGVLSCSAQRLSPACGAEVPVLLRTWCVEVANVTG